LSFVILITFSLKKYGWKRDSKGGHSNSLTQMNYQQHR